MQVEEAVPTESSSLSLIREDGFYVQFSGEKDIFDSVDPEKHYLNNPPPAHFYNLIWITLDALGQKYFIEFGSAAKPLKYRQLDQLLLKEVRLPTPNFYPYYFAIEGKFGRDPNCSHKNPVKNAREFYNLDIEGCRCHWYTFCVCRCEPLPERETDCKCISDKMRFSYHLKEGEYQIVSECRFVDYLGLHNCNDPVMTGQELSTVDFKDLLAVDDGLIGIRK